MLPKVVHMLISMKYVDYQYKIENFSMNWFISG